MMSSSLKTLPFKNLRGARTDKSYTNMEPFEATIARNVRFYKKDEVTRRKGGVKYNTTQYAGAGNIQGLFNFKYGAGLSKFLVAENGILYTDTGINRTSIKTGFSTTNKFSFDTYNNLCWITDGGTTALQKYDGTIVTQGCITAPSVGTFAAADSGNAGNPDGVYYYLVTFYVSATGQESAPFPLASAPTVTVVTNQINLTGIPVSSDTQVTARRIYRTTGGGAITSAGLVTTITNNTATTYTDNTADSDLGALIFATSTKDAAPIFVKTTAHNDRGWGFTENSSILYYSYLGEYWYYPQGNDGVNTLADAPDYRIYVGRGDGDKITNIIKFYDYLIIFKQNSIWALEGYDRTQFNLRQIEFEKRVGCVGFRAAGIAGNWCYFIDVDGIYRTNGLTVEFVGLAVEAFFDDNNPNTNEKIDLSTVSNSCCIEFRSSPNKTIKFSVPITEDSSNSLTLNYDYLDDSWNWDTGFKVESWAIKESSGKDILIRGDDYGYVWEEETLEGDGGIINGTCTTSSSTGLTDSGETWTVDDYKGVYVEILEGTGLGQRRLITSNTADTITISEEWETNPDTTSVYTIGGIDGYYLHCWSDSLAPAENKVMKYVNPWVESTGNYDLTVLTAFDLRNGNVEEMTLTLTVEAAWDVNNWDVMYWDDAGINYGTRINSTSDEHRWSAVGIKHKKAGQPFKFKGYNKIYYDKGIAT